MEDKLSAVISSIFPKDFQEHFLGLEYILIHSSFITSPISMAPSLKPVSIEAPLTTLPGVNGLVKVPTVTSRKSYSSPFLNISRPVIANISPVEGSFITA